MEVTLKLVGHPIRNPPFEWIAPQKKNPGCCYPLSRTNPYPYPNRNLGKSSSTQKCRLLNMIQKGPGGWQHDPKSPAKLMFTHNLKREKNMPALKLTAKMPENGCLEDDELSFWSEGSQTPDHGCFLYESTISLSPQAALLKLFVWQSRPMQRSAAFQACWGSLRGCLSLHQKSP